MPFNRIHPGFVGATIYARFRICDDTRKNLTVLATDSRPGVASYKPLHYAGGAEALRRLYTPLDASGPVPRSRPLHRHTPRP